jgi:hypothetical protein
MKKILAAACVLALTFGVVWAGDAPQKEASKMGAAPSAAQMTAMKAELAKCAVCKNMLTNFDEIMPSMKMEVVQLNNGMAMSHRVTDAKKLAMYRENCKAIHTAGEACMTMTDEQAKTDLCDMCQGIRSAVKAGAVMSTGETKNGDLMVLSSTDPAVQKQLAELGSKCAMMVSQR